ncbi:O-antigen ligase family protein [Campylobacter sp. FMV-PI01]|uniref:O-antigen ligase family protein n=1 Tax=Campylobacter portucalensis TaxID=2608384 RepID=A0A6L5WJX4_9BACT|nr:O-antigen ligase family protein [Campylobacter portucalensis]MSN96547.1 O-antigen ligase family protein [Campylobacter portucalensis]
MIKIYKNRWLNLPREIKFEKIYFYMGLVFAFTMPISRVMISFFIIAFPLVWIIEGDFKRKWQEIKESNFLTIFMLFYIIILISAIFFSDNSKVAFKFSRLYLYWLSIFVLATSIKKEWINSILSAFLFGMLISEFIAYGVFFEIWQWKHDAQNTLSPFMLHIDYSVFLAFTSILLFTRILSKFYSLKQKFFMLLFFISTTGNLFLQTGRTGQVAYIVAIIVMFFLHYKFRIKAILLATVSIIIIYSLSFNFSNNFQKRVNDTINEIKIIKNGNLNTSWGTRMAFFITTYEILKQNPIFGIGLGDFEEETAKILKMEKFSNYDSYLKNFMSSNHYHNQFLMISVQMGLIGLFFCITLYFLGFKMAIQTKDRELRDIFILFMVIYTVGSFADPLWNKQFTQIIWVFIISLMMANKKYEMKDSLKDFVNKSIFKG